METLRSVPMQAARRPLVWAATAGLAVVGASGAKEIAAALPVEDTSDLPKVYCDNHDDGNTLAEWECSVCTTEK